MGNWNLAVTLYTCIKDFDLASLIKSPVLVRYIRDRDFLFVECLKINKLYNLQVFSLDMHDLNN